MKSFWTNFIYTPIFKLFLAIVGVAPAGSIGLSIIAITILVKAILLPLSLKSSRNNILLQKIQPKIDAAKIKFKDQKEQATEIMRIYKEEGVHPMSGCLPTLIQIPILIALYRVLDSFFTGVTPNNLSIPQDLSHTFLGLDLFEKSIVLAVLVAASQFVMARMMPKQNSTGTDMQSQMARSMQLQMKLTMPIMMGIIAYVTNGAVSLYILISIILSIIQEFFVRRYYAKRS